MGPEKRGIRMRETRCNDGCFLCLVIVESAIFLCYLSSFHVYETEQEFLLRENLFVAE